MEKDEKSDIESYNEQKMKLSTEYYTVILMKHLRKYGLETGQKIKNSNMHEPTYIYDRYTTSAEKKIESI